MHILITGHRGFVGRHFVHRLEAGNDITGVDISTGEDCRVFFKRCNTQFDLVIHLAAIVGGRALIEGQPLAVATDLSIDSDFFSWVVRTKQHKVIYYSSSAAYPISLQSFEYKLYEEDINLSDIGTPDMTYGWAKLTGEMLAQYAEAEGTRVHIFRPFSGYGPGQSLDYPFPSFIQRGLAREKPFTVWGSGTAVRDFIHIDDIVEATLTAVKEDVPGPVNLGLGRPTSFNELAMMIMELNMYRAPIHHLRDKPVGVSYRCSSNKKMLSFYTPKVTLEEGIVRALGVRSP